MVLPCLAESVAGLPLHIQKITDNVIRIWVGDYISSTAVSAIAAPKGIVARDGADYYLPLAACRLPPAKIFFNRR
ncbi:MAG: hypothetical protein NT166_27055 [Candidatus Aminicenantes bacterium]|nr:hypothetical protein [Candidatus Aminicenantes bacterium]